MTRTDNDVLDIVEDLMAQAAARGFCWINKKEDGFEARRALGLACLQMGCTVQGTTANISVTLGPKAIPENNNRVPPNTICVRAFKSKQDVILALRLGTSWYNEHLFWARIAWLFTNALEARTAYEQGTDAIQTWQPTAFIADEYVLFFERDLQTRGHLQRKAS
jgi:hypothetical protein